MNKCLKISFSDLLPENFLHDFVQKNAKKLNLEGLAQHFSVDKSIKVIVCGNKDDVDKFVDLLHKGTGRAIPEGIQIEPFLRDKDYRGVFRVIE